MVNINWVHATDKQKCELLLEAVEELALLLGCAIANISQLKGESKGQNEFSDIVDDIREDIYTKLNIKFQR